MAYDPKPERHEFNKQVKIEPWTGGKGFIAHYDPEGNLAGVKAFKTQSQMKKWSDENLSGAYADIENGLYSNLRLDVGSLEIFDGRGGHQGITSHLKRPLTPEEKALFDSPSESHMAVIGTREKAFRRLQAKNDRRAWTRDKDYEDRVMKTGKLD